jgi:hypothetical protein
MISESWYHPKIEQRWIEKEQKIEITKNIGEAVKKSIEEAVKR